MRLHLVEVDRDGERAGPDRAAVDLDRLSPRRRRPSRWWARRRKFCAPSGVWKPTRSAPSRPRMTSSRCGSCMNSSIGGNGMCRKKPMRRSGPALAQHRRDELQLVVLHPHGRARRRRPRGRLGETPVDLAVGLPPVPVEHRRSPPRRGRAARSSRWTGPRSSRSSSLVGQRHRVQADAVDLERLRAPRPAAPAQPTQVPRLLGQDRLQRGHQPARAAAPLPAPGRSSTSSTGSRLATTTNVSPALVRPSLRVHPSADVPSAGKTIEIWPRGWAGRLTFIVVRVFEYGDGEAKTLLEWPVGQVGSTRPAHLRGCRPLASRTPDRRSRRAQPRGTEFDDEDAALDRVA